MMKALVVLALLAGCASPDAERIILMPVEGKMMVNAVVPLLDRQVFGLGIPETIGSAEAMWLVNHPDAEIAWRVDERNGRATTTWTNDTLIRYDLELIPAEDHVDLVMSIANRSAVAWHDVFAFNCVSPAKAAGFRDSTHRRTYISVDGRPVPVADIPKERGPRPGVTVYPTGGHALPPFAEVFHASSAARSDASWVVVVSETGDAHMATTAPDAAFLFTNTSFGCIHAAPSFGDIEPGGDATVRARASFSKGGLGAFLERYEAGRVGAEGERP